MCWLLHWQAVDRSCKELPEATAKVLQDFRGNGTSNPLAGGLMLGGESIGGGPATAVTPGAGVGVLAVGAVGGGLGTPSTIRDATAAGGASLEGFTVSEL